MPKWAVHRIEQAPRERMIQGVERRFVSGERTTVAQIWLEKGALVPRHTHESEQVAWVVSGALRFTLGDGDEVTVRTGEILVIPSGLPHSAEAVEDTYDIDLFAPRREDWISGDDAYLRGKR
ncbi:MAG: cupin domain-containing protein [Chloroflexi bacterium]|nr:cupin domain-containing protein [Chloroflexota bacterium]